MSALGFMTSGGYASIGGDIKPGTQQRIQDLAASFGRQVSRLVASEGVPRSNVAVWRANCFLGAVDKKSIYFIFADGFGETQLIFWDASDREDLSIEVVASEARKVLGDPIFGFYLPIRLLVEDATEEGEYTTRAAQSYVNGLLKAMETNRAAQEKSDDRLCFVIMSFSGNPTLQDYYEKSIKPTVEGLGYRCERVDEQEFNGSIRDRILGNIRQARFIIADMTEARPNCYYELGVAHSLHKDVIHLTNKIDDLHFDVRDFNFIVYSRLDELAERLRKRIEATVGGSQ